MHDKKHAKNKLTITIVTNNPSIQGSKESQVDEWLPWSQFCVVHMQNKLLQYIPRNQEPVKQKGYCQKKSYKNINWHGYNKHACIE